MTLFNAQVAAGVGAVGYALHVQEGLPDQILPEVSELPEGVDLAEIGELGAVALSTAQVLKLTFPCETALKIALQKLAEMQADQDGGYSLP